MNFIFESKITKFRLLLNLGGLLLGLVLVYIALFGFRENKIFQQEAKVGNWDLSTTQGRELASIEKPVSPYTVRKCGEIKHTDGEILTFCVVNFNGTSGGFYDANKSLMVVGSFNENTLIHEIFHAASIHNYKKGFTDMLSGKTQEKMAYDAENLLMQIRAFQEDLKITPDLSNEKKERLGIPTEKLVATTVYNEQKNISTSTVKKSTKNTTTTKKVKS